MDKEQFENLMNNGLADLMRANIEIWNRKEKDEECGKITNPGENKKNINQN